MRKYGKVDSNHKEIVEALRAIGATVHSLAPMGKGCPDLLVGFRGRTYLIEVKSKGGKLTMDQMVWINRWTGGKVHVAWTFHDIMAILEPV